MSKIKNAIRTAMLAVLLCVAAEVTARAECGDVTGEGDTTASDALAVLRRAVGQSINLTCSEVVDFTLLPTYGSVSLISGFVPDPKHFTDVVSGGPIRAEYLGGQCRGRVARAPDFVVNYTAGAFALLRFYYVGAGDPTMIVRGPDGYLSNCNDDSHSSMNPTVDFDSPSSGTYQVWIGTLSSSGSSGTLSVTENSSNHP